jgi:beta-lactamase superfamily II metal-dependent hydrolase
MSVFRLTMLPASEGDSLILSYGPDDAAGSLNHVVVDGGRKATLSQLTAALKSIAARGEGVELLVLSHIDADHIDGLLALVKGDNVPVVPKAVWYNGQAQIAQLKSPGGLSPMGFPAAEAYGTALAERGWAVNAAFAGKPIYLEPHKHPIALGELTLTLISPSHAKLWKLREQWNKWRQTQPGLQPMGKRPMPTVLDVEALSAPSQTDSTAPNGSSIAFIAEYDGRRVLMGADAHPDVLIDRIEALAGPGKSLPLDLVKLPHHASRANVTRALIERLACRRFAISTSGAVFGHPDPEAIARVLRHGQPGAKSLSFNYASDRTLPWDDAALKEKWDYSCEFPPAPDTAIVIDI